MFEVEGESKVVAISIQVSGRGKQAYTSLYQSITAVESRKNVGSGTTNTDYEAAFDYLCMTWVYKVLMKKKNEGAGGGEIEEAL